MLQNMRPLRNCLLVGACLITMTLIGLPAMGEDVTSELNPKLRALLQREMVQVEAAMTAIYSAMIRGDHEQVREKGQAIHESFILSQELTDEDRKALKSAVPADFLKLDQAFHKQAASLAESAERRDMRQQLKIFGQMTESCVACHSRYVSERFEGLADTGAPWLISISAIVSSSQPPNQ